MAVFGESFPDFDRSNALLKEILDQVSPDFNEETVKRVLHTSGVLWAWIPKWMGGLGLHPLSVYSFAYQLSQTSMGLTNIIGAHYAALGILSSSRAFTQLRQLVQDMKQSSEEQPGLVCLAVTEPNAGSDFENAEHLKTAQVMTRAKPISGGFEITGQKIYVSNGPWAKWVVFSAYQDLAKPLDSGILGIIDLKRKGITRGKKEQKLGQNLCPNCMVFFDQVLCAENEVLLRGHPNFSKFVIQESLGPGRSSVASMSLGILKSLEGFRSKNGQVEAQFAEFSDFFTELQGSHLAYRNLGALNAAFSAMTQLPFMGKKMESVIDSLLESEKKLIKKGAVSKRVEDTFKRASALKAKHTQKLQSAFEEILSTASFQTLANPLFQQQLRDARLLEIIEGTTEVCLRDAEAPRPVVSESELLSLENRAWGFVDLEIESAARAWFQKESTTYSSDHEWVKSFSEMKEKLTAASILYTLSYEDPEKALQFFLKTQATHSADRSFFQVVEGLGVSEQKIASADFLFPSFRSVVWKELQTSDEFKIPSSPVSPYLFPILLLGAADRAWQYAKDYAEERYQGGKLIIQHPEVAKMLVNATQARISLKIALQIALQDGAPLSREVILPLFHFARDTAQVLGGMSYMEEHPIAHLYLSILTLAHLSLQKGTAVG